MEVYIQMKQNLLRAGFAGAVLIASSAMAMAAPAVATANVNVRSGPSAHYSAVDTLRRGEGVDVQQCRGSWCFVEKRGPDGWVSSSYLAAGGVTGGPAVLPDYGPNFGSEPPRPYPPRQPPRPRPDHGGWGGGWGGGYNGGHNGNGNQGGYGNGGWENDDDGWVGPHR